MKKYYYKVLTKNDFCTKINVNWEFYGSHKNKSGGNDYEKARISCSYSTGG